MKIEPRFRLGQTVYHMAAPELPGIVTGFLIRSTGPIYLVVWGSDLEEKSHFDFELTAEKTYTAHEN